MLLLMIAVIMAMAIGLSAAPTLAQVDSTIDMGVVAAIA